MWILRVIYSWIYDTIVYFCFCFFLIYQILMNVMAITEAVVMTASTKLEASTVSAHPDTSFWMIPRPVWVRSTFIRNGRGSNFVCLLITFPPFNNVFALVWSCQTFFFNYSFCLNTRSFSHEARLFNRYRPYMVSKHNSDLSSEFFSRMYERKFLPQSSH